MSKKERHGERGERGEKGEPGIRGLKGETGEVGLFVGFADCIKRHEKLDLALFGADGRGGITRDIQEIKTATSIFRTIVLPVILSLASAAMAAYVVVSR